MSTSTERKTLNTKILERLDETKTAISDLTYTMQLFAQEQKGEHCNINTKIDEVRLDVYGDDKTMGMREKLRRLWDDAQNGKASSKAIYLAVIVCVITSVLNLLMK